MNQANVLLGTLCLLTLRAGQCCIYFIDEASEKAVQGMITSSLELTGFFLLGFLLILILCIFWNDYIKKKKKTGNIIQDMPGTILRVLYNNLI